MVIIKFAVLEKTEPGLRFYAFAYEETGYNLRKLDLSGGSATAKPL